MTARERARANALALRANGLSVRQVAERVGVPKGTVATWLRGRGEWYELRECALCGERFIAASGRRRFCTPQHQTKHRRVFGPPTALDAYRERARPGGRARAATHAAGRQGGVRPTSEQRAQALALRAQGVASREIAARLDLTRGTVAALLRRRPSFAPRACRLCGEPFVPTNGRRRYCTPAHWLEHQRGGEPARACRLCGEPFTPSNGRQRFCTPAHQREHARRHGPPRTTAGWRERVDALEAEIARVRAQLDERNAA